MSLSFRAKVALAGAAGLLVLAAAAVVALLNFDWNQARPWLNARASEALGRPFAIVGDLSLTWEKQTPGARAPAAGWREAIPWPHLVAAEVRIGDPPAMGSPAATEMAHIRRLSFSLNPLALLERRLVIPVLSFEMPVVSLRRAADGRNNWVFSSDDKPFPWRLELQRVILTQGSVHLIDAVKRADITAEIATLDADPVYGVTWQARGRLNGEAVSGRGKAGAVLSLQQQIVPYPIMAHLQMGQTLIDIHGTLTKPSDLAAFDMRLKLSGVSMGRLYALSGIVLPETPPFATEGRLIGSLDPSGAHWIYEHFSGRVGASDIAGSLDYQTKQTRGLLSGTITSHALQFSDLAPLIGADSEASKAERGAASVQPANKVLPVEPFKTERWTSIDADIKFSADTITRTKKLPISRLSTHLRLQDGVLHLAPLNFDLAGGSLSSDIRLDGSGRFGKEAIKAELNVTARRLQVKLLLPALESLDASVGEINGQASLSAAGNSVGSLLGAANGEVKALIDQGTVSKLLLERMGLNFGNVVLAQLFGDKQVKLNCLASEFGVRDGLMQTQSFVVDTEAAILEVSGSVDLARERVDLTIDPKSKGLRVLSLRAPLYLRGSFKDPTLSVDKGVMALRAGGALALALVAPVAALLPLVSAGPGQHRDCADLLAHARVKPLAPAPGRTYAK